MTAAEELKIINRVILGDRDAFSRIVLENQQNVYALALKMTKNDQDALDISQEAFLKAFRSVSSFRGGSRISVWLYRITYNLCLDHLRSRSRTEAVSLTRDDDESSFADIPDREAGPQEKLERKELREGLYAAVDSLSPEHREIFMLREFTGLSYAEIALELSISEGTVKSRLARARRAIADFLIKNGTIDRRPRQNIGEEGTK